MYPTHVIHSWGWYKSFKSLEPFHHNSWQRWHHDWNCSLIILTQAVQGYNDIWSTIYCYTIPCCNYETTKENGRSTDKLFNPRWRLNGILSECVSPYLAINPSKRICMRCNVLRQIEINWVPSLQWWMLLILFWFTLNKHNFRSHIEYCAPFTSKKIYKSSYSSVQFSLLYQSVVFISQVRQTFLDLTGLYFKLEDAYTGAIDLINDNGGFTVTGWYKCGEVNDRTILHQNKKSDAFVKPNVSSDQEYQVNNSKITFHPCLIKPTNLDFFVDNTNLYQSLYALKFDVSKLFHLV